jgi:hypothetical protein
MIPRRSFPCLGVAGAGKHLDGNANRILRQDLLPGLAGFLQTRPARVSELLDFQRDIFGKAHSELCGGDWTYGLNPFLETVANSTLCRERFCKWLRSEDMCDVLWR